MERVYDGAPKVAQHGGDSKRNGEYEPLVRGRARCGEAAIARVPLGQRAEPDKSIIRKMFRVPKQVGPGMLCVGLKELWVALFALARIGVPCAP